MVNISLFCKEKRWLFIFYIIFIAFLTILLHLRIKSLSLLTDLANTRYMWSFLLYNFKYILLLSYMILIAVYVSGNSDQTLLGLKKYLTMNSSSSYRLTFPFLFLSMICT